MFKIKKFHQFMNKSIIAILCCSPLFLSGKIFAIDVDRLSQQGQDFYQRGEFAQAIENWRVALDKMQVDSNQHFNTLIRLATAYQKVGNNHTTAYNIFQQALSSAERNNSLEQQVLAHSYIGDILLAMQQPDEASIYLEERLPLLENLENNLILANFLNSVANVLSVDKAYDDALEVYQLVADIAEYLDNNPLKIQTLTNQAQILFKSENSEASIILLKEALSLSFQLPASYDKAFNLLSLGQLAVRIQKQPEFSKSDASLLQETYKIFTEVLQLAELYKNQRLKSYAQGFLGQLYAREKRYSEALKLTQAAIYSAQEIPEILYFWEWQQGQFLQAQQNLSGALVAYQQALDDLQAIRAELMIGQRNAREVFDERVRPIYYSLADILLQQAAASSSTKKAELLIQARETVEKLKTAELQDYFQNECVLATETPIAALDDQLAQQKQTAVLYPILLANRIELLLSLPDGIHQTVIPLSYNTLGQTVLKFRRNLQRTFKGSFIHQSKQLYQWLITPIKEKLALHNINTIVIIPDGVLRTIPMSALYDAESKEFLFEQFALATTPGLTLTDPRRLSRENIKILLNGLSESVQGFPALPSVVNEINTIASIAIDSTVLLNKDFSLNNLNQALENTAYEIVHISSHGQFDRNPKESFLLTYDDKLTMNRLENLFKLSDLRKEKVELLTLSACQTAVGDERAALGLAGVAIKSGARSALASLWFVDDDATSVLIAEFYQQLQNPDLSKAQALQNAQKKLASQKKFRHPAYWAPFLLIGNWL